MSESTPVLSYATADVRPGRRLPAAGMLWLAIILYAASMVTSVDASGDSMLGWQLAFGILLQYLSRPIHSDLFMGLLGLITNGLFTVAAALAVAARFHKRLRDDLNAWAFIFVSIGFAWAVIATLLLLVTQYIGIGMSGYHRLPLGIILWCAAYWLLRKTLEAMIKS